MLHFCYDLHVGKGFVDISKCFFLVFLPPVLTPVLSSGSFGIMRPASRIETSYFVSSLLNLKKQRVSIRDAGLIKPRDACRVPLPTFLNLSPFSSSSHGNLACNPTSSCATQYTRSVAYLIFTSTFLKYNLTPLEYKI